MPPDRFGVVFFAFQSDRSPSLIEVVSPRLKRSVRTLLLLVPLLVAAAAWTAWPSVGATADGARLARITRSPLWTSDRFVNPQPMWNNMSRAFRETFRGGASDAPSSPVAVFDSASAQYAKAPMSGLRVTWFGHSSSLIEIDGVTVLTDPIWSARSSPVTWAGPARWYPPVLALTQLPRVDAVLISHDHYDHLDRATIQSLNNGQIQFIVPLGVGAHLASWGVAESRITELDWWDSTRIGALTVIATPARHASGRINPQRDRTLWAGYALLGATHRAWYSGDTGMHDALSEIGTRYGPFDVTLIESGQYDPAWPDWHLGPEQAVDANRLVRGRAMIPVHWALFKLAHHGWTEPAERVLAAARCGDSVHVLIPQPGRAIEPTANAPVARWWPDVAWETRAERPVVATRTGVPADRYPSPGC
jgi:L-ascorbate metabolism protein UlaG (beta-lactamase superfamily)